MIKRYIKRTVFIAFMLFAAILQAFEQQAVYTVITGYGNTSEISQSLGPGESLIESKDNTKSYKVKTVTIQNEGHLLELMGAQSENELTDIQKGLLETYRFSKSQGIADLYPRVPDSTEKITLNLVDIAGYEDQQRFPNVKNDFWPVNRSTYRYNGRNYVINGEIRISGTDVLGFGPAAAERMKATYAHEFGHSLDLTRIEENAYGHDEAHYINEKIKPKASFAEGFANFIRWLFFGESTEEEFRDSLQTVKIEKPEGGYDEYPVTTENLVGEDYLNIEAINTLIFARLSTELPNGREVVLNSFQRHNSAENRMSGFLKNFIKDHPEHALTVAQILDRETFGRLSSAEIRLILGNSAGVENYLATRSGATPATVASATEPVNSGFVHTPGMIYKWKDANGNWQFTDHPPPSGVDFTTRTRSPEPERGREIKIEKSTSNPFDLDY